MLRDLTWRSAPSYLMEAVVFAMDDVAAAARQLCAENFESLFCGEPAAEGAGRGAPLQTTPPPVVLEVMRHDTFACDSQKLSIAVAGYWEHLMARHRMGLAAAAPLCGLLEDLTRVDTMPVVSPSVAIYLLKARLQLQEREAAAAESTPAKQQLAQQPASGSGAAKRKRARRGEPPVAAKIGQSMHVALPADKHSTANPGTKAAHKCMVQGPMPQTCVGSS